MKKRYKVIISFILILSLLLISVFVYININTYEAHAFDDTLYPYQENQNYLFFEHENPEAVIVIYQGGLVSTEAYIPFSSKLRDKGYHVYLMKMPLNLAILNTSKIDEVIQKHASLPYYGVGHSLGGAALSFWIEDHPDALEGMIYLASYSSVNLTHASSRILSIYGTRDGVLSDQEFFTASKYYNDTFQLEMIIGGNHANYFNYGPQEGDLTACISMETQQLMTIEMIVEFIKMDS